MKHLLPPKKRDKELEDEFVTGIGLGFIFACFMFGMIMIAVID